VAMRGSSWKLPERRAWPRAAGDACWAAQLDAEVEPLESR
jgi:hypothetical protein